MRRRAGSKGRERTSGPPGRSVSGMAAARLRCWPGGGGGEGRGGAEVLAEWRAGFPKIEAMLARDEGSPAFAYDVLVHEHDIRGALGHTGISNLATVTAVVEPLVQYLGARITKAEKPALKLVVDGSEWVAGSGDPEVTATTGLYEL